MLNIIKITLIAGLAGLSIAAPVQQNSTSGSGSANNGTSSGSGSGGKYITIKNNCGSTMTVGWLTNGQSNDQTTLNDLNAGASQTITPGNNWGGRVWGRNKCDHSDMQFCGTSGAAAPASLAEFLFNGANSQDYYDVSLVDGYNIPISISPNGAQASGGNSYQCGSPKATSLPSCPSANVVKDNSGNYVGCKSTCSAENTPETCCTGAYNSPDKCTASAFANQIKSSNPSAYSFAYDDKTSTFACSPSGYTVTLCAA